MRCKDWWVDSPARQLRHDLCIDDANLVAGTWTVVIVRPADLLTEGICQGGAQKGLGDDRSALCRHFFRLLDLCVNALLVVLKLGCLAAFDMEVSRSSPLNLCEPLSSPRHFLVLENVHNLLSVKMRPVMEYLLEAQARFR